MAGAWAAASVLLGGLAGAETPAPIPAAPIAVQQSEAVEAVLIEGNDLIAADAWLAHLTVKPGDPVDREALRAEFQTLWNTASPTTCASSSGTAPGAESWWCSWSTSARGSPPWSSSDPKSSTATTSSKNSRKRIPRSR